MPEKGVVDDVTTRRVIPALRETVPPDQVLVVPQALATVLFEKTSTAYQVFAAGAAQLTAVSAAYCTQAAVTVPAAFPAWATSRIFRPKIPVVRPDVGLMAKVM